MTDTKTADKMVEKGVDNNNNNQPERNNSSDAGVVNSTNKPPTNGNDKGETKKDKNYSTTSAEENQTKKEKDNNINSNKGAKEEVATTNNISPAAEEEIKERLLKKKLEKKSIIRRSKSGGGGGDDKSHKSHTSSKHSVDEKRRGRKRSRHNSRGGDRRGGQHNGRDNGGGGNNNNNNNNNNNMQMMNNREYYRGPGGDFRGGGDPYYNNNNRGGGPRGDYRGGGDPYGGGGRGGGRGGGWGNDYGRGGNMPPPRGGYYNNNLHQGGGGGGGGGGGRIPERDRDIYGRNGGQHPPNPPPPQRQQQGGGGGMMDNPMMQKKLSRSESISSKSYSRSPSPSRSRSRGGGSYSSKSRSRSRSYSRSPSHSDRSRSDYSRSPSRDSYSRSRSRSNSPRPAVDDVDVDEATTKDQRTIFVSQLVMRADERDIGQYFKRKVGTKVRDVILLRDKRTGRHKGCAYVELGSLDDVERALKFTGKTPEFQRFPILIKCSESEKNVVLSGGAPGATAVFTPPGSGVNTSAVLSTTKNHAGQPVELTADGKRIESQKVYIGSIDRCVTQAQLYALFSQFGDLDKIILQIDMATGISRGFAFLSFRNPKDANLAIQTMSGQMLAGRPLKTGWANTQASATGIVEIKTDQFPDDANEKIQKVNEAMLQLTGTQLTTMIGQVDPSAQSQLLAAGPAGALGIMPSEKLVSVADAALDAALGVAPAVATAPPTAASIPNINDAKVVGRLDNPTQHILVHNMFDKDEETEKGWEDDIKLDFEEECAQYGKIINVVVMSKEVGGKIYASFDSAEGATKCAKGLAGRWFDKRQLRVEFVDSIP